jgi:serine/threonine-protein kinase
LRIEEGEAAEQESRTMPTTPAYRDSDPFTGTAYRAVRRLAVGGAGIVYEAEHLALGKRVAIKLLRLDAGSPFVDRLRVEAQALARLRSPHLVAVHDFGETADGRPFYVMDLLQGRTLLAELRARGCLPPHEAVDLVQQLLRGLAVAHRAGLVHRDIKLENVFVAEEGGAHVVKILDFGIAKVLPEAAIDLPASRTSEGVILGTPRFMAPEQVKGRAVDARADVYAAGAVLYELLTGRDPLHDVLGAAQLLLATLTSDPEPPSRIASQPIEPALDDVVLRALAKDPARRYGSAEELSAALVGAMHLAARRELDVPSKTATLDASPVVDSLPAGVPAPGVSWPVALVLVAASGALSALVGGWLTGAP